MNKEMSQGRLLLVPLALAGAVLTGCANLDANVTMQSYQATGLTEQEVAAYGESLCRRLDEQHGVASESSAHVQRLASLTDMLNGADRRGLDFAVYTDTGLDAFSTSNGCVRLSAGMLDHMSDGELMAVLAHEIGHVRLGHADSRMRTALAGHESAVTEQGEGGELDEVMEAWHDTPFSRRQERAADSYAYEFLLRYEQDPAKLASVHDKFREDAHLTATHPDPERRAERVRYQVKLEE